MLQVHKHSDIRYTHCDIIIVFCKNIFPVIIQCHNSETEGGDWDHISHPVIVETSCAARWNMCANLTRYSVLPESVLLAQHEHRRGI